MNCNGRNIRKWKKLSEFEDRSRWHNLLLNGLTEKAKGDQGWKVSEKLIRKFIEGKLKLEITYKILQKRTGS